MNKDSKEFVKESLNTEIKLLKLYSVFLVVLVFGVVRMALSGSYNKGALNFGLFFFGIVALVLVWILFLISLRRIYRRLNQLKNEEI
jgi:hypothetical protein